jgi:hypothetical protein
MQKRGGFGSGSVMSWAGRMGNQSIDLIIVATLML